MWRKYEKYEGEKVNYLSEKQFIDTAVRDWSILVQNMDRSMNQSEFLYSSWTSFPYETRFFSCIRTYGYLLSHIVWVVTYSSETTFVRGSTWKLIPPINQKKVCERKSYNRPTSPEFVE